MSRPAPDAPIDGSAAGPSDLPGSWPVVASEDLYRDDWVVALRKDRIHQPGSDETFDRWVFEHPGAVIVLAVDEDERVACVRQYRHPAGTTCVELPAVLRDADGEDPLETARRELLEEVELVASEWRELFALWPSAGITSERHVFERRQLQLPAPGAKDLQDEADPDREDQPAPLHMAECAP